MKITLVPQRRDDSLSLNRVGDCLTVNGTPFDFSDIPEGATLPCDAVACKWLAGDIDRLDGEICLTLILPYAAQSAHSILPPEPLYVSADGPISLPDLNTEDPSHEY